MSSTAANMGIARVVLDGGAPQSADFYEAAARHQLTIWEADGLSAGTHTLRVDWTGTKNDSSSGTKIGIDAFDITGGLVADTLAPTTEASAPAGWVKTAATVSLSATDTGSWVRNTYYRINGSAPSTYTVPFTVSAEGTTTVEYWSVDGAGNTESAKSTSVRIDKGSPATTDDAPANWVRGPVSVHLDSTDPTSGVDAIHYSTDGSAPSLPYTGNIDISAEGTTTLLYRATDAGATPRPHARRSCASTTPRR